jgi:hypothetical protein
MSFDINKWKKFLNENENNPIPAYHGSRTKGIKKFLLNKADPTSHSGFGLFFTDNESAAYHYGPNIYKVSLNVKPITGIGWDKPVPQDLLDKIKQDISLNKIPSLKQNPSDLPENLDGEGLMEWLKSNLGAVEGTNGAVEGTNGAVEGAKYLVSKGIDHYYHKLDDPYDGKITFYKVLDDSVISNVKEMSK